MYSPVPKSLRRRSDDAADARSVRPRRLSWSGCQPESGCQPRPSKWELTAPAWTFPSQYWRTFSVGETAASTMSSRRRMTRRRLTSCSTISPQTTTTPIWCSEQSDGRRMRKANVSLQRTNCLNWTFTLLAPHAGPLHREGTFFGSSQLLCLARWSWRMWQG